jgi:hypothetical protein
MPPSRFSRRHDARHAIATVSATSRHTHGGFLTLTFHSRHLTLSARGPSRSLIPAPSTPQSDAREQLQEMPPTPRSGVPCPATPLVTNHAEDAGGVDGVWRRGLGCGRFSRSSGRRSHHATHARPSCPSEGNRAKCPSPAAAGYPACLTAVRYSALKDGSATHVAIAITPCQMAGKAVPKS